MASGKILLPFFFSMNLLISCQKAEVFILDPDLPEEVIVLPDTTTESSLKIAIIGDSISSYKGSSPSDFDGYKGAQYAVYYPHGDVDHIENMWWYKVAHSLGITIDDICNCSWSGSRITGNSSSTNNAFAGCSTKRIEDLSCNGSNPDIVFCYISCNDWASNIPIGNWSTYDSIPAEGAISTMSEAYALMISKIKEHYPSCLVFCLTNLDDPLRDFTPGWPSNNRSGISVDDWNKSISELSETLGCHTINLQECGINYENASKYTVDGGLHPNDAGMTLIANKVIKELAIIMNAIATDNDK